MRLWLLDTYQSFHISLFSDQSTSVKLNRDARHRHQPAAGRTKEAPARCSVTSLKEISFILGTCLLHLEIQAMLFPVHILVYSCSLSITELLLDSRVISCALKARPGLKFLVMMDT